MPIVFFDIVGTCFGYDAASDAVEQVFGSKLAKLGIPSLTFFQLWLTETERDTAYMSFCRRPKVSTYDKWGIVLPRLLWQVGVPKEEIKSWYTEEEVKVVAEAYAYNLRPRPGLKEMLKTLEDGGVQFMAMSAAVPERVKSYFKHIEIAIPDSQIEDITHIKGIKPEAEPYDEVYAKYKKEKPDEALIFAASHAWDVCGAKAAGFETAWVRVYEGFECEEEWGKQDVVVDTLPELGKAIVAKWGKK